MTRTAETSIDFMVEKGCPSCDGKHFVLRVEARSTTTDFINDKLIETYEGIIECSDCGEQFHHEEHTFRMPRNINLDEFDMVIRHWKEHVIEGFKENWMPPGDIKECPECGISDFVSLEESMVKVYDGSALFEPVVRVRCHRCSLTTPWFREQAEAVRFWNDYDLDHV